MKTIEEINNNSIDLIKNLNKEYGLVSFFRVVFFALFIIESFRGFSKLIDYEIFIGIISFLLLVLLIIKSNILSKRIEFLENIKKTCQEIVDQGLNDTEHIRFEANIDHPYSNDLDIFGKNSLFTKINRCQTYFGAEQLKEYLQSPLLNTKEIYNRQNAIKELSTKIEWNVNFIATTKSINSDKFNSKNISNLFSSFEYCKLNTKLVKILLVFVPMFNVLLYLFIFKFNLNAVFFLIPLVISGIIIKIYSKIVKEIYDSVNLKSNELKKYGLVFSLIEQEVFNSTELISIQNKLISSDLIKKISQLIDLFDNRKILIFGNLINIFLLWDLKYAFKIEKCINENIYVMPKWFEAIGEFEALISFGLFAHQNKEFNYPLSSDENKIFNLVKFSHPLIPYEKRINNDFSIINDNSISIITGANMTGKSTFLRSIGINMVLAMNGCPVCAESFTFFPVSLFTSMKTSDSLAGGSSYFNEEIKRLSILIEKLKNNEPQFIILDEILKGTNSVDKLKGSKLFLEKMIKMKTSISCIIATHDLELTKMESEFPKNIKNYCFELHNFNESLNPDYKLCKGVTKSMNAIRLMKEYNIID